MSDELQGNEEQGQEGLSDPMQEQQAADGGAQAAEFDALQSGASGPGRR